MFGRTVKSEIYNWVGLSVHTTTVNSYNARNQIKQCTQYAGAEGSGSAQSTTMSYDGYGRLVSKHVPDQDANTTTTYSHNADDTIASVTDARGASTNYGYNGRHLVTGINYSAPASITPAATVLYAYDAAGNRTAMTDGSGSTSYTYDPLSRMNSETRTFTTLPSRSYSLSYTYNLAGQMTSITDASGATVSHTHDSVGRLSGVTGSTYAGVTSYASEVQYRAWGAVKSASFGNGSSETIPQFTPTLQPAQFRLTGSSGYLLREDYSYYADGAAATNYGFGRYAGNQPADDFAVHESSVYL